MKEEQRPPGLFDGIAGKYDLLNSIISLGQARKWRERAVSALGPQKGTVLDLAAGTCDITLAMASRYPQSRFAAADPSLDMLECGRSKIRSAGISKRVGLVLAKAEHLPFAKASMDAAIISFGVRNFEERPVSLRELGRVIRPEGVLVVLELTFPEKGLLSFLVRIYTRYFIPFVGGIISSKAQYEYLSRSIKAFCAPEEFIRELKSEKFEVLKTESFMAGACHCFTCRRIKEEDLGQDS